MKNIHFLLVREGWVMNLDNEKLLVKKTLNGDINSFSELVSYYQGRLYNFIYKMTESGQDAEEIVQEVFIKVYNNLFKYNDKYSFSTWVYTIALNTFRSEYKKNKRHSHQEINDSYISDKDMSPEERYIEKENKKEMQALINTLNIEIRAILALKYVNELSYSEIGEILKMSPDAVKMKVYRAKQSLCRKYGEAEKRGVNDEVQV